MKSHTSDLTIHNDLAILPGDPAPYAGKVPGKKPAKERFVRFDQANWADLQGFLQDRLAWVKWSRGEHAKRQAQHRVTDLRVKMDILKPLMAHDPTITVAKACQQLRHQSTLPS